jgi:hypothetical protein
MSNPYKTYIEVIIKPISSLYDLLDRTELNGYLKELYNDYSKYIIKKNDTYRIITDGEKDEVRNRILNEIYKLKFDRYIADKSDYEFNYIIVPYNEAILKKAYPTIPLNKIIHYDYDTYNIVESIQGSLESNIRKIERTHSKLKYIKIIYHVPLYDKTQIEFRFQKKQSYVKSLSYKDVFNVKKLQRIKELPMISKFVIIDTIQEPIETLFTTIKKRDKITPYLPLIQFFEILYKYGRNKQLREDIKSKSNFYKAIVLYSVDYLDKDISKLSHEYYYELPSVLIKSNYISKPLEDDYMKNKYKVGNHYKCIGKISKVGNLYKFTVVLKQIMFELSDTIQLYIKIEPQMLGVFHSYTINNTNEYLIINNETGTLKIFDENDIKLLKYNNLDKGTDDNNELYLSKNYPMDSKAFNKFLNKKDPTSVDLLNHLKSPTLLKKYELYIEQKHTPKLVSYKDDIMSLSKILFQENTLFHIKPRKNSVVSNTQYKAKLDKIIVYDIKDVKQYEEIWKAYPLQQKYKDIIYNKKPNFLIYVHLLLQKGYFKQTLYDCKEIKHKLLKHTIRLFSGGSKLKQNNKTTYKTCRSSRRKL